MLQHTLAVRQAAVNAYSQAKRDISSATDRLLQHVPANEFPNRHAAEQFIRDVVEKCERTDSVANQYQDRPAPNPKKVSDAEALECCQALKRGIQKTITVTFSKEVINAAGKKKRSKYEEEFEVTEYCADITKACQQIPKLKETIEKHQVDPHHLLKRMYQVDKDLTTRRPDFKRPLSTDQKMERMLQASFNLYSLKADPEHFLKSICFIDEFAIWMVPGHQRGGVYCSAHDAGVHVVVPLPDIGPYKKIKMHILAAINWVLGAFWMEFTTGTTEIQRIHGEPPQPYRVSASSHTHWLRTVVLRHCTPICCSNHSL